MHLGKTLIGAIIGGALGIAAMIAVQYFTGFDRAWLAILVAVLTGLGVRAMVSTHGHASYARGAVTAILVLAAYWAGTAVYAELVHRGILAKELAVARMPGKIAEDDGMEAGAETPDGQADIVVIAERDRGDMFAGGAVAPGQWRRELPAASPWDYVAMVIAALVGYELGRGTSGAAAKPAESEPREPQEPEDKSAAEDI